MRRQAFAIVLLLPLLPTGGCVTHKLWTESRMDEWNEPAGNPNLRVFHDERKNDLLITYEEFSIETRPIMLGHFTFTKMNNACKHNIGRIL